MTAPGPTYRCDCLVVGAGISGLLAAVTVAESGSSVMVLDKGRGLGGRMATRRWNGAIFDHGAQFFTARDASFLDRWVQSWLELGLVAPWYEWPEGEPHFRAPSGMNAIGKHLVAAHHLDVRRETLVHEAERFPDKELWQVRTASGEVFLSSALVLSAPLPQALAIVKEGETQIHGADRAALSAIRYQRCLAVLALLDRPSALETHQGALKLSEQPLQWIGDNQRKGLSPEVPCVTLHSTAEFAEAHWDHPDEERLPPLLRAAEPLLQANVRDCQLHRWGFSRPLSSYGQDHFHDEGRQLACAGDGFGGGRVEGAALSGLAAGKTVASWLAKGSHEKAI